MNPKAQLKEGGQGADRSLTCSPSFLGSLSFVSLKSNLCISSNPSLSSLKGTAPTWCLSQLRAGGKCPQARGPRSTTGLSSSSVTERKSRTLSKHQENQLKDIQRPKSYMVRFALNLKFTEGTGSEFTHAHRLPPEESRISDGSLHKEETCGGD